LFFREFHESARLSLERVRWIDLPHAVDERGVLTAIEGGTNIPFDIRRVFYMHKTPNGIERGGHAHPDTQQVVVPLSGRFDLELSDGTRAKSFEMVDPNRGLYMPPMTWVRLKNFTEYAVCLVLADTRYDKSRSIRTWEDFLAATRAPKGLA